MAKHRPDKPKPKPKSAALPTDEEIAALLGVDADAPEAGSGLDALARLAEAADKAAPPPPTKRPSAAPQPKPTTSPTGAKKPRNAAPDEGALDALAALAATADAGDSGISLVDDAPPPTKRPSATPRPEAPARSDGHVGRLQAQKKSPEDIVKLIREKLGVALQEGEGDNVTTRLLDVRFNSEKERYEIDVADRSKPVNLSSIGVTNPDAYKKSLKVKAINEQDAQVLVYPQLMELAINQVASVERQ